MSFFGQSIRNNFPLWSKIRRDDSSIGAISLDIFGEVFEELRVEILRRNHQQNCLSGGPIYEPGFLYVFQLNESLNFNLYKDENRTFRNIEATGEKDGQNYTLTPVFSYSELCKSFPTRYELNLISNEESYLLTTVEKNSFENIFIREVASNFYFEKYPGRIYLNIYDSEQYETSTYNRNMLDKKYIVLRGTNFLNKKIEEIIPIENDGHFQSKNIFKSLEHLNADIERNITGGKSIEVYGFDGVVEVLKYPLQVQKKKFPFKLLVKKNDEVNFQDSLEENESYFQIIESESKSVLQYIFHTYESGTSYINKRTDLEKDYFEQVLLEQDLLNDLREQISVQDFTFDYLRNKLTVIDNVGKIYWYNLNRTIFFRPQIERTKKTNISFESEKQQVVLNETLPLFFSLERAKGTISEVIIARKSPSQSSQVLDSNGALISDFNFDYLQEDLTWSRNKHFFSGRDDDDFYLRFEGKTVDCTFDEYGQYDFYVFSFSSNFNKEGSLNSFKNGVITEREFKTILEGYLEDEFQTNVLIDTYSIFCESLIPEHSISSGIIDDLTERLENPEEYSLGIFFDNPENNLYVVAGNETKTFLYKIKEYKDYIIFDYESGSGALLEDYSSVTITLNNEFTEQVNYNG
jgi:hypothetical protein